MSGPNLLRAFKAARRSFLGLLIVALAIVGFQSCGPAFGPIESGLNSSGAGSATSREEEAPEEVVQLPEFIDSNTAARLPTGTFSDFPDTRIFQRAADGKADVKVNLLGSEPSGIYRIVRVLDEAGNVLESSVAQKLPFSSAFSVRTNSGMAYRRLRVSYFNAQGGETARWTSSRFAVGEVFIAAGQSNAATHGQSAQASSVAMNRTINPSANRWLPLNDPMPVATNWTLAEFGGQALPGGSPWPIFADSMSAALGVPVAVISVAYGGTSVQQWQKGNAKALFPRLVQAANAVSGCSFRAVLWHQGESDSLEFTSTAQYMTRMNSLLQDFRADTGCTTQRWVVAQAAYVPIAVFLPGTPGLNQARIDAVSQAQRNLWQSTNFAEGPNTDQWTATPALRFDQVHFSSAGLQLHALSWRDKVIAAFAL